MVFISPDGHPVNIIINRIDVVEHLSDTISLDLEFTGSDGQPVKLGSYFIEGRPVILIMGYYTCPMLCNLVANGVSDVVREMPWLPGKAFSIKGLWIGLAIDALLIWANHNCACGNAYWWAPISIYLIIPAITSFIVMNFTGSSTYTSLSGVQREMKIAVPPGLF